MITADALNRIGCRRHGFFTREGGVSEGAFASLNCGFGSGDDPARVADNRARAMAKLDLAGDDLATLYQVHSADVVVVETPWRSGTTPHADAAVTTRRGVALGVLTADCAPVLMADVDAGVVGAAHAGWRGALDGVIEATVAKMCELGARPERIAAAVGPCIQQQSYEVGAEFHARFVAADAANTELFAPARRAGHYLFDLPGYVARRLGAAGVLAIEVAADDTCADAERFFSYRRATLAGTADYGRTLAAIALDG